MKRNITMVALAAIVSFATISCKKKVSDAELTTQATSIITANPSASVKVEKGQAILSGTFASEADRTAAINSLKNIKGIEGVQDVSTIETPAPVVVNAIDPQILKKVQDALKDFPAVKAETINGELTITGNVSSADARKIKESIDGLKIGKYTNKLVVK